MCKTDGRYKDWVGKQDNAVKARGTLCHVL